MNGDTGKLEAIKDRAYQVGVKNEAALDEKLTKSTQWTALVVQRKGMWLCSLVRD